MKKLYFFIILFLCGCSNRVINYEIIDNNNLVYALSIENNDLCLVNVDYKITNEKDVFLLYTIYQNYLPVGYTSPAISNISLLDCYSDDYYTYYVVDIYLDLVTDLDRFIDCISKTNRLYGFNDNIILKKKL